MKIKVWHKIVSLICIAVVCGMTNLFVIAAAETGSDVRISCCCNPGDEAACSCDGSCKIHDVGAGDSFSEIALKPSIVACGDVSDHALMLISLKYVPHIAGDKIYVKPYFLPTHYSFNIQPHYYTLPDKPPEFSLA